MAHDYIFCRPPVEEPTCIPRVINQKFNVNVSIGFLTRNVGNFTYHDPSVKSLDDPGRKTEDNIIAGSVVGILIFGLLVSLGILFVMMRKRKLMKKEKAGLLYKMDKIEAKFETQCSEEISALQTAVSDLTSNLKGENALFREYDVYAMYSYFSFQAEQAQQALDSFKGLLRKRQFLLILIKTLEKEQSFTKNDKSSVATILMILNHDNMEYVTSILTTLLDDLIDQNIASGTPKLLLSRSECVTQKLFSHWLSVCLYLFLKERCGSALYMLYKAIKIQSEKGPIDYITNCGKYTLSEDKLFTPADNEINPVTLTLDVTHVDVIDNKEKQISVQVLDCDTVTQAKAKMLEIFYKNVPYSQRPSVHSTELEVKEDDRDPKILLSDDDDSSTKDGIWKRINTLQHYKIHDGAKVNLFFNIELKESFTAVAPEESPDSFIVGNFRSSKPIVRSISGSNFWHLTKQHQTDDEVQLASDLFLPGLLNTKGTLQTYIDDLFQAVLSVGEKPPIIIKFLFDHLDSAASRRGLNDPDVLHAWKCNSLLLCFWMNIIKNPEFVFDVHKPPIVDSCLSVVAQTLMNSCSTVDLVFCPSSQTKKLLFAKEIPRYQSLVRQYFEDIKMSPAISDQELNSYLKQKVSQKFYGKFNQSSVLTQMYEYAAKYRNEIYKAMDNTETPTPESISSLSSKLESVFKAMDC
ncbi:plexin-A1-like [Ruditapes philippinarum]|uniref:plexin-A1-like n=1 Tax=Ruditapes philippinarum TaxID=129788 RepID=UPI00295AE00B|nr:plexin-A1-like [Ruditapes philippinarum]